MLHVITAQCHCTTQGQGQLFPGCVDSKEGGLPHENPLIDVYSRAKSKTNMQTAKVLKAIKSR